MPLARAIGNQLYQAFEPSLNEPRNYLADTPQVIDAT